MKKKIYVCCQIEEEICILEENCLGKNISGYFKN
jgi:hypothetical protein